MSIDTLHISVVGHTNTGKTSLLRTLLRETYFGEVADESGTTQAVTRAFFSASDALTFFFYDTPGFEDPLALSEYYQEHFQPHLRRHSREAYEQLVNDTIAQQRFPQEIKIIRQLLQSTLAFYVIDTRETTLSKYECEITTLHDLGIPILPILNFSKHPSSQKEQWVVLLRSLGLHTFVEFDTFSPPRERRLFEKIALLMDEIYAPLQLWMDRRELAMQQRRLLALNKISDFIIDLSAFRYTTSLNQQHQAETYLQEILSERERSVIEQLLELYSFEKQDIEIHNIDLSHIILDEQFFTKESLAKFSSLFLKGSTVGAGAMASVDLFTGFTSLGAASLLGGLVGGVASTTQFHVNRLKNYLLKEMTLSFDARLILIMSSRLAYLLSILEGRGHAATDKIELYTAQFIHDSEALFKDIAKCRVYPEWSALHKTYSFSSQRIEFMQQLTQKIGNMQPVIS